MILHCKCPPPSSIQCSTCPRLLFYIVNLYTIINFNQGFYGPGPLSFIHLFCACVSTCLHLGVDELVCEYMHAYGGGQRTILNSGDFSFFFFFFGSCFVWFCLFIFPVRHCFSLAWNFRYVCQASWPMSNQSLHLPSTSTLLELQKYHHTQLFTCC